MENKQKDSLSRRAASNLAMKMSLEDAVKPALRKFFNTVYRDFGTIYAATSETIDVSAGYNDDLTALLKNHYRRVAAAFYDEGRKNSKMYLQTKQEEDTNDELISAAILIYINEHAAEQAEFITTTTNNEIDKAILATQLDLQSNGVDQTNAALAAGVVTFLRSRTNGRVDNIALTETQNIAETTKGIEASVLSNVQPLIGVTVPLVPSVAPTQSIKEWSAVLDQATRDSHVNAHGQTRPVDIPFDVQGQKLRWPADTSLGATVSNIINCRCSALYTVKNN